MAAATGKIGTLCVHVSAKVVTARQARETIKKAEET